MFPGLFGLNYLGKHVETLQEQSEAVVQLQKERPLDYCDQQLDHILHLIIVDHLQKHHHLLHGIGRDLQKAYKIRMSTIVSSFSDRTAMIFTNSQSECPCQLPVIA